MHVGGVVHGVVVVAVAGVFVKGDAVLALVDAAVSDDAIGEAAPVGLGAWVAPGGVGGISLDPEDETAFGVLRGSIARSGAGHRIELMERMLPEEIGEFVARIGVCEGQFAVGRVLELVSVWCRPRFGCYW